MEVNQEASPPSHLWGPIFVASLSSVGTAAALAASGAYLHRLGYISASGKTSLARYSQHIGLPALFFSKMVACPSSTSTYSQQQQEQQDEDYLLLEDTRLDAPPSESMQMCPGIWDSLSIHHAWLLVVWPIFVVACGLTIGTVACWISHTPKWQQRTIIVAVAFANSTGLPTTLLAALQEHASRMAVASSSSTSSSPFDPDPNLVLSLYLVFYPVLQWSIGSWLLSFPSNHNGSDGTEDRHHRNSNIISDSESVPLVLDKENHEEEDCELPISSSSDVSLTRRPIDTTLESAANGNHPHMGNEEDGDKARMASKHNQNHTVAAGDEGTVGTDLSSDSLGTMSNGTQESQLSHDSSGTDSHSRRPTLCPFSILNRGTWTVLDFLYQTVVKQPPVCGALLGLLVSSSPFLRGLFVGSTTTNMSGESLITLHHHAPFEWLLNAIATLGRAAIPINMTVLGVNLSIAALGFGNTSNSSTSGSSNSTTNPVPASKHVSFSTILAVVLGKLVVMPLLGFLSVSLLLWTTTGNSHIPPGSALLVMMMVFLTPTSNTVMVMVDLADGLKEEIARIIAWEYAFAPVILSCTVAIAVSTASGAST